MEALREVAVIKTGFMKGRIIADCTQEIYDLMFEAEMNEISGLILYIDFIITLASMA